jgi:FkbM family methyltransferase
MERALDHLVAKGFRPAMILDIGAARGNWTRTAAERWPEAKFFMIDPLRENAASLKDISRDNRFAYLLAAVASESGERTMNLSPDLDGSSLLKYSDSDPARQRIVPVVTVDELLSSGKILPPQLVKIDVQGFEIEALDGGAELFRTAEVLILEVNLFRFAADCPRVEEVVRYMADRQFVLFDVAGMLRRPFENDLGQMDLVFVSERSALVNSNRWA